MLQDNVALWILLAFSLGLLVRPFGLPPLVGFLFAGFGLKALGLGSHPALTQLAHAGVLLLLFNVGLKLRIKSLFRADVVGSAILHLLLFGAVVAALLAGAGGLSLAETALIAFALSFSSTVVAAKVLEDKKELRAFHGRLAIGILIVQDLLAVAFLSAMGGHEPSPWALALLGLPLLRPILLRLLEHCGHEELLVLFGLLIALVLGGMGFEHLGLSGELGALVMGAMLAGHGRATELAESLWSLKEVFLVGFFLQIGLSSQPDWTALGIAAGLALLLPVKIALFFALLTRFRLRARSALLAGLSLGTYSEFGLIVGQLGVHQGLLPPEWLAILALAMALSFILAAPLNRLAHPLYMRTEDLLRRLESARRHPDDEPVHLGNSHLLIMGMGRVGTAAYDFLRDRERVVGLDSDPGKVERHRKAGRRVLYADAEDPDLWQNLDMHGIRSVLLCLPDTEANRIATTELRRKGFDGMISALVHYPEQVPLIREAGADLVFNYFEEVGVGFAEQVWEAMHPEPAVVPRES